MVAAFLLSAGSTVCHPANQQVAAQFLAVLLRWAGEQNADMDSNADEEINRVGTSSTAHLLSTYHSTVTAPLSFFLR